MIHTCLTSHIYIYWCFDSHACFDQVWRKSLIADVNWNQFPFSPQWTCYRAGIFSVSYKSFMTRAIFLPNHLLKTDGNRYVMKPYYLHVHCNAYRSICSSFCVGNLVFANSFECVTPRVPRRHSLTFVIGRATFEQRKFNRHWLLKLVIIPYMSVDFLIRISVRCNELCRTRA